MVFRIGFFVCAPGSPVQVTVQFMAYDTNFSLLIACMFMLLYNRPKKKRARIIDDYAGIPEFHSIS